MGFPNERQKQFLLEPLNDMSLIGIPGGGKTTAIIHKILNLHLNEEFVKDNFLLLSFSNAACNDFKIKGNRVCKEHKNKVLFSDNNVKTLHSLAGSINYSLECYRDRCNSLSTSVFRSYLHLARNGNIVFSNKYLKNCKVIFVDEAQDISQEQYDFIMEIKKNLKIPVILIGDINQNIYQFQGGSDKFLREHPGKKIILVENNRSTEELVNFIDALKPWKDEAVSEKMISTQGKGKKPIIICESIDFMINDTINKIKESKIEREKIAIIGPVKVCKKTPEGFYKNDGLQIFYQKLLDEGIECVKQYKETTKTDEKGSKRFKIEPGKVNLLTAHASKGLEFDKVFLINFHFATMGIVPDLKDYNEYKYLWYVGISRARKELDIYVENNKQVWPGIINIDRNLYEKKGKELMLPNLQSLETEKKSKIFYSVTELLDSNEINSSERERYTLGRIMDSSCEKEIIYNNNCDILNFDEYSALYGSFIETIYTYFYHKKHNTLEQFIQGLIRKDFLIIPKTHVKAYISLKKRLGNNLNLNMIENSKNHFSFSENELIKYVKAMGNNFNIIFEDNNLYEVDSEKYKSYCNNILEEDFVKNIFNLTLYKYQVEYESKDLLKKDFSEEIESLMPTIDNIESYVNNTDEDLIFQKHTEHPFLPIVGILDAYEKDNKIIEMKFSKQFTPEQAYQTILYYNNISPLWDKHINLEILNLFEGTKYTIDTSQIEFKKINSYFHRLYKFKNLDDSRKGFYL